jgi:hypothetical protein
MSPVQNRLIGSRSNEEAVELPGMNSKDIWLESSSRDSSVGIATGYGLEDQGEREFESR